MLDDISKHPLTSSSKLSK